MRVRALAGDDEVELVAQRMRATLVEVVGARGGDLYDMPWLRDRVRQHLDPGFGAVWVADQGHDRVVGHSIVRDEGATGLVSTTWVHPEHRRRGVADRLLDHGERWLMARGATTLATNTAHDNTPLIRLFARRGYAITTRADEMVQLTRSVSPAQREATLCRWSPALAYRCPPGSHVDESDGGYVLRTPGGSAGQNEVLMTPRRGVDAVISSFDGPFKWCLGLDEGALETALTGRGLRFWGAQAMVRETGPSEPDVRVTDLDDTTREACAAVFASGWGGRVEDQLRALDRPDLQTVIAWLDGEAVGAASTHLQPGCGYLMGAVVLPRARRQGLYGAMVRRRLARLNALDIPLAVTHARDATSAPILERLGFRTAFTYRCGQLG